MTKSLFTVLIVFVLCSFISIAQDKIPGNNQITVPPQIQSLYNDINAAENNGDWNTYYTLRNQIISEWNKVNPEVAKLYRTVSNGVADLTPDGAPAGNPRISTTGQSDNFLFETPAPSPSNVLWGNDVMITGGKGYDVSMDVSRDGDVYIAVMGRLDGSSTVDSIYIYKSTDGGESWTMWSSLYASTHTFKQVELMCFDGYPGSTGDSYLLLYFLFNDGWLRVGRTATDTPSWNYYDIVGSSGSNYPTDFAVDRNFPASGYRAICVYDSLNIIKSVRSDPASYGTVWQDAALVGSGTVGKDIDMCYGLNGGVYVTFNGFNSGNLYVIENTSSGDPVSWGSRITIADATTDTTRHPEVISSRDNIPDNTVSVVFERKDGSSYDLYTVMKPAGSTTWESMTTWVIPDENKWPSLYSYKSTGNQVFRGVFERSLEGNTTPRSIRYKYYDGTWQQSEMVSDSANDVTGIQKPEVGDLDGNTPVFAYVGANYVGVYFDNSSWTLPGTVAVTSPNGGESWEAGSTNDITYTYTGVSDVRIELSTDNGSTWSDIQATTPATGTYSWEVPNTPSTDCLVRVSDAANPSVMDESDAVFTITPLVGVKDESGNVPHVYALSQNYPDPFNPSTRIKYQLPQSGFVTLKVYDILGNEVATLINSQQAAGRYEVNFDASRLTSGIYIYQITVNNYVSSKKMMMLK